VQAAEITEEPGAILLVERQNLLVWIVAEMILNGIFLVSAALISNQAQYALCLLLRLDFWWRKFRSPRCFSMEGVSQGWFGFVYDVHCGRSSCPFSCKGKRKLRLRRLQRAGVSGPRNARGRETAKNRICACTPSMGSGCNNHVISPVAFG